TDACSVFEYDEAREEFHPRTTHNTDPRVVELSRAQPVRRGEGMLGRLPDERRPLQISDITAPGAYEGRMKEALPDARLRALLAIPRLREDGLIGALTVQRRTPGEFPPETIELLSTFATQSALAIQNARLFRELEEKSRELEVASRHKSEFLANMSHELRTPLNAIIGYSEMLQEEAADAGGEAFVPDLRKIHGAGRHLLELINSVLDLSKI